MSRQPTTEWARQHPAEFAELLVDEGTRTGAWATLVMLYGDRKAREYAYVGTGDADLASRLPQMS